ncbi:MAG: CapA family protein [Velocimicrobium sp.]
MRKLHVVLAFVLTLILFHTASANSTKPNADACICITISAIGDCTLGMDDSQKKLRNFNLEYKEQSDDSYFFKQVYSILSNDDLTLANLEGTLTTNTKRADKQYAFKGLPSYVSILKAGSIEAVNLANNHTHDYGFVGFEDTQSILKKSQVHFCGAGHPSIQKVKGVNVGLIGINTLPLSTDTIKNEITRQINICHIKDVDLIIISFHWGEEGSYIPNKKQQTLGHFAIDEGADLVLGHHPHVMQSIETYNGKFIVYSLGNFCFGGNTNPSDKDTFIYQQTFTFENGSLLANKNTRVIPCSLSSVENRNNYQPQILEGNARILVLQKLNKLSYPFGVSFRLNGFVP